MVTAYLLVVMDIPIRKEFRLDAADRGGLPRNESPYKNAANANRPDVGSDVVPTLFSGETMTVYLTAGAEAISSVLIAECGGRKMSIYFISKVLHNGEVNYNPMEELVLALVHTARRLKRYFQVHPVLVLTDTPIKHVHENRSNDRVGGLSKDCHAGTEQTGNLCGASSDKGVDAGLTLIDPEGEEHTYALRFAVPVSNNESEYEALLSELRIALKMEITALRLSVDSQLVTNQMNGTFEARDPAMQKYL
ncbi:uncharacterized protein [Rutidosis leptorrhynchoides]|uniref:uncharacterized protein n=1 Tax=Rutidosis leptorrhynchoides TaxID=125765 RepID=UPI003A98F1FD